MFLENSLGGLEKEEREKEENWKGIHCPVIYFSNNFLANLGDIVNHISDLSQQRNKETSIFTYKKSVIG
jgi:hypothetical protein